MKVALINSSELSGGAAIACNRLYQAHKANDVQVSLLVQTVNEPKIDQSIHKVHGNLPLSIHEKSTFYLEKLQFLPHEKDKRSRFAFSTGLFGRQIHRHPIVQEADVIHLHWINKGFVSLRGLQNLIALNKPIVWTMHDMWPITGGCHYSDECTNYKMQCGNCMMLRKSGKNDLSNKIWFKKNNAFQQTDVLQFVACSEWLASICRNSSMGRDHAVTSIPNCIDIEKYKSLTTSLNLSKINILFQAMNIEDERKGFHFFLESLKVLKALDPGLSKKITVNVIGKANPADQISKLGYKVNYSGLLKKEADIVSAYQKAHLYIIPSLQDNLPNTVMEALSCSVPVVGFNTGGIPEMVKHLHNGYIAPRKDSLQLAKGILWSLNNPEHYATLRRHARESVEQKYSYKSVSNQYVSIYKNLLTSNREKSFL